MKLVSLQKSWRNKPIIIQFHIFKLWIYLWPKSRIFSDVWKKINYPDFFSLLNWRKLLSTTNKPCNLQLGLHLQCQLYLSSIVKYGFVRDIPGRSENAVPMVYRHARRRSLLKVAVCQPLGLRDIILARAAAAASLETFSSTSCCGCVAKAVSIGEVRHQLKNG